MLRADGDGTWVSQSFPPCQILLGTRSTTGHFLTRRTDAKSYFCSHRASLAPPFTKSRIILKTKFLLLTRTQQEGESRTHKTECMCIKRRKSCQIWRVLSPRSSLCWCPKARASPLPQPSSSALHHRAAVTSW